MALTRKQIAGAVDDLAAMQPVLNSAVQHFAKQVETASTRMKTTTRPRLPRSRLPAMRGGPIAYRATAMPRRIRSGLPVDRRRGVNSQTSALAQEIQAGAQKVAGAIQDTLLALRKTLESLHDGLEIGALAVQTAVDPPSRSELWGDGETLLSGLGVFVAVALALGVIWYEARGPVPQLDSPVNSEQIDNVSEAIAVAEGYNAAGPHDGHSLPYRLHNPGSLKKPALGADDLPTWQDTGLIEFPDEESGWAALRHQVALMLSGHSGVYRLEDTIDAIAEKYADGDKNWGTMVAHRLRVPTNTTLGEIARGPARIPAMSSGPALPRQPPTVAAVEAAAVP